MNTPNEPTKVNKDDLLPEEKDFQAFYGLENENQPSPDLDAKILASARKSLNQNSSHRWFVPVTLAATVALFALIYLLQVPAPLTTPTKTSAPIPPDSLVSEKPDLWLRKIEYLLESGEKAEALRQWELFRQHFPDYPADDLEGKLQSPNK